MSRQNAALSSATQHTMPPGCECRSYIEIVIHLDREINIKVNKYNNFMPFVAFKYKYNTETHKNITQSLVFFSDGNLNIYSFVTKRTVLWYSEMSVKTYFLCSQYLCQPLIVYKC